MVQLLFLLLLACGQNPAGVGRIDPPGGQAGTTVTITGSGFTPEMQVELGGVRIVSPKVLDSHRFEFQSPELPPGEHSLVITLPDGTKTTIPRAFATDTTSH